MTKKKRDSSDERPEVSGDQSDSHQAGAETPRKRARARRLVLKSIVAGGSVTTAARSLPEQWTRPVTDSVVMPAHAQTSPGLADLTCRVESYASDPPPEADIDFDPSGLPVTGGSVTTVSELVGVTFDSDAINIDLSGISATLNPADAGDVTLSLTAGGDFTLNDVGPQDSTPGGSGVADFSSVDGDLVRPPINDQAPSDLSTGNLELRFSAPGAADCVIQFTFTEDFPS